MPFAVGLAIAAAAGIAAGYVLAGSWLRFYAVVGAGLAAVAAAAWAEITRYPTGEGWVDRTELFGHWVPNGIVGTLFGSALLWIAGTMVGAAVAWLARQDG